jgi:predicted Zn-dependent protease
MKPKLEQSSSSATRVRTIACVLIAALTAACATNPDGRRVLKIVDDKQMASMGLSAFDEMKSKGKISADAPTQAYVKCVADRIIAELPDGYRDQAWEVVVFEDATPNAFALPGGKIGVHTGIMSVAKNESQLAAVIGHELAHVTYKHGAERVSQQLAMQTAAQAAQAYQGSNGQSRNPYLDAALGIGGQLGILLPFSRKHESEADKAGQQYLARAGYDPSEAAKLWENMIQAAGGKTPPQWLSTHPDPEKRMQQLAARAPDLMPLFETAKAQGKGTPCK